MSGQKQSPLRRRFGVAPLPLAAVAAIVAGTLTLMIWQSPRSIVADVNPLILDFGTSAAHPQRHQRGSVSETTINEDSAERSGTESPDSGILRRPGDPIRSTSSNGGLVLEWPRQRKQIDAAVADAKTQARRILEEAEAYLRAGDLRRALNSARLAYSYPVKWEAGEQSPEELLAQLEELAGNPAMLDAARQAAIQKINSANRSPAAIPDVGAVQISDHEASVQQEPASASADSHTVIGVWKPAAVPAESAPSSVTGPEDSSVVQADDGRTSSEAGRNSIEKVSATRIATSESVDLAVMQPYQSQPAGEMEIGDEPRRLDVNAHHQSVESVAEFPGTALHPSAGTVGPGQIIISDQRAAAVPSESPVRTLTFDVLATLTTIFAVLFFGALFLFLAILAIGRKLIGEKGVAFRIELVNSPLTVQSSAAVQPAAAPATQEQVPAAASAPMTIDPDFEGILSMSEHRARERESAILQQFIENNVSLHQEVKASRRAA